MAELASMFLKLTGKKPNAFVGESESEGYEGQIEIDDWNWALERPPSSGTGSASQPGGARADDSAVPSVLSFGKLMCKASANMLQAMVSGEHLKAVITLEEDSDIDFELVVTLEDVRIIDYSVTVTSSDTGGKIDENWTLNYESVSFDYVSARSGGKVSMKPPLLRPVGSSTEKTPAATDVSMRELATRMVEEAAGALRVDDIVLRWRQIVEEAEKNYKPGREKPDAKAEAKSGKG